MILYHGHKFKGFNQPRKSWLPDKKMVVLARAKGKTKLIHFGDKHMQDFRQHRDLKRRASYLKRSSGIRNKQGELTKDNKLSANYWSRKILWNA